MIGQVFIRQYLFTTLTGVLAGNRSWRTKGFMIQFLISKKKVITTRLPKSAWQSDHLDHFVQHYIGSIHKSLLASFATDDFAFDFALATKDMTFSTLKQIFTTKFPTKAAAQKSHQIIILEQSIHVQGWCTCRTLRSSRRLCFGLEHLFFFPWASERSQWMKITVQSLIFQFSKKCRILHGNIQMKFIMMRPFLVIFFDCVLV